jgi:hypothetical protein
MISHAKIVFFCFYFCVSMLLIGCSRPRGSLVREYSCSKSCKVAIRSYSEWEISVPIYLEIVGPSNWKAVSGPFYFSDPEYVESDNVTAAFKIENTDRFFIVWSKEESDTILAIIDVPAKLIYPPPEEISDSAYYDKVDTIISELRQLHKNVEIKLKR